MVVVDGHAAPELLDSRRAQRRSTGRPALAAAVAPGPAIEGDGATLFSGTARMTGVGTP
ncbi:hypothetical protein [Streptomyces sp. NPDC020996]|uniref:hypothetical protein n=1 Tax=Streptomyces sp. NPDC020996 TaxID=3154791 RepID=UPI0033F16919